MISKKIDVGLMVALALLALFISGKVMWLVMSDGEDKVARREARDKAKRATMLKELEAKVGSMEEREVSIERVLQDYEDNPVRAQRDYEPYRLTITGGVVRHLHTHPLNGALYISLYRESLPYSLTDVHCYVKDEESVMRISKGHMIDVVGVPSKMSQGTLLLELCEVLP